MIETIINIFTSKYYKNFILLLYYFFLFFAAIYPFFVFFWNSLIDIVDSRKKVFIMRAIIHLFLSMIEIAVIIISISKKLPLYHLIPLIPLFQYVLENRYFKNKINPIFYKKILEKAEKKDQSGDTHSVSDTWIKGEKGWKIIIKAIIMFCSIVLVLFLIAIITSDNLDSSKIIQKPGASLTAILLLLIILLSGAIPFSILFFLLFAGIKQVHIDTDRIILYKRFTFRKITIPFSTIRLIFTGETIRHIKQIKFDIINGWNIRIHDYGFNNVEWGKLKSLLNKAKPLIRDRYEVNIFGEIRKVIRYKKK